MTYDRRHEDRETSRSHKPAIKFAAKRQDRREAKQLINQAKAAWTTKGATS